MFCLSLLFSLLFATSLGQNGCPCNSGKTLADSYTVADEVFTASVLGTSNDGTALVTVTEVFKGTSFASNDLVYIRYSCGTFPVRTGYEGVFFTTTPDSVGGSFVTHLVECTRNGPITPEEKSALRAASSGQCVDGNQVYSEGERYTKDCLECVCSRGEIQCEQMYDCQPTGGSCTTDDGQSVDNGRTVKVECNTCTCRDGSLLCTEMACPDTSYCWVMGEKKQSGEIWETGCTRWMCERGSPRLLSDDCDNTPATKSKQNSLFIVGISLGTVVTVVLVISVVAIVRNRIRARQAELNGGILLDDANQSDSSESELDNFNNNNNNNGGFSVNNTFTPSFGNTATQPFMYQPSPSWGGQPLATTPMVLMTQTGEPVVVQVAYM